MLLHGFGVSGHLWQRVLPYLAQQHTVYIVDLPGHGQSRHMGTWQLRAIAPLLAEWLRSLHIAPVMLIGQSMGGAIAIHLAASAPELVSRLVLVSAAGIPMQTRMPTMLLRSMRSMLQSGSGGYPVALLRDIFRLRPFVLWQAAQEVTTCDFRAELAILTSFTSPALPILIIWGERDVLLPIVLGHALHAALPRATFVRFLRSGHRPMLTEPQHFSEVVLAFLQEV